MMLHWAAVLLNGPVSPCNGSAGNDSNIPCSLPWPRRSPSPALSIAAVMPLFHQPDNCCSCGAGVAPPTEKYSFPSVMGHNVAGTYSYTDGPKHTGASAAKLPHWPIQIRLKTGTTHGENKSITWHFKVVPEAKNNLENVPIFSRNNLLQ